MSRRGASRPRSIWRSVSSRATRCANTASACSSAAIWRRANNRGRARSCRAVVRCWPASSALRSPTKPPPCCGQEEHTGCRNPAVRGAGCRRCGRRPFLDRGAALPPISAVSRGRTSSPKGFRRISSPSSRRREFMVIARQSSAVLGTTGDGLGSGNGIVGSVCPYGQLASRWRAAACDGAVDRRFRQPLHLGAAL